LPVFSLADLVDVDEQRVVADVNDLADGTGLPHLMFLSSSVTRSTNPVMTR
jgi:hypothetical protein